MLDYKQTLVTALNTILPTYYELFVNSEIQLPCITYIESRNTAREEGDTLWYSELGFTIKVWATDLSVACTKAGLVDNKMRELGFKRTSSTELSVGNQICKIMVFEALALEKENN